MTTTTPGNFRVELTGGRWDGTVLEVPLASEVIWLGADDRTYTSIDAPIEWLPSYRQIAYGITPHRCEQHGITIARYAKAPA